jgi:hypothetical protein
MDFAEWSRSEIDRLRAAAMANTAEADSLERALERYEAGQKPKTEEQIIQAAGSRVVAPAVRRARKPEKGDKNSFALEKLRDAAPAGASMDFLFQAFQERFGPAYKRSSLRALLFHQKKLGNVTSRNGLYMLASASANLGQTHATH